MLGGELLKLDSCVGKRPEKKPKRYKGSGPAE